MNAAKCMVGTASRPSAIVARRMLTCKLRSEEVMEYPFFGSSYFQHIKYSWKDAKSGAELWAGTRRADAYYFYRYLRPNWVWNSPNWIRIQQGQNLEANNEEGM